MIKVVWMTAGKRIGLLLISHGSPSQPWNATMERVAGAVEKVLKSRRSNLFVKLSHLEFAKPDIADGCDSFEREGCDRILAYPLFISVSGHSEKDIPNALNIRYHDYADSEIRRYLGNVPVTYACPLDHGPVLPAVVAECASELSEDPANETVLVLSHGGGCDHFWNHMHARVAAAIRASTGISSIESVAVGTGRAPARQDRLAQGVGEALLGCSGWIERPAAIEEIANVVERAANAAVGGNVSVTKVPPQEQFPPYNLH